jgi:predicted transcriptional regulator
MTELLEKAVQEAAALPEAQQLQVATLMLEEVTRARIMAGIERGEADFREGRVLTQDEAKARMARWLK